MGIRFCCPNGHKLNVKSFQAGRRGICPFCGVSVLIPTESTRPSAGRKDRGEGEELRMQPIAPAEAAPRFVGAEPAPQPSAAQPTWHAPAAPAWPQAVPMPMEVSQPAGDGAAPAPMPAAPSAPAAADPLAEAPNAVWYVRPAAGGQYGPATSDVMRTWLTEGRVAADSLVWREGWRDWKEAAETFPQLKPDGLALFVSSTPASVPASSAHPPLRPKSGLSTSLIITILILVVIVLFGVFLMVLFQQPQGQPEPPPSPAAATGFRMMRATG